MEIEIRDGRLVARIAPEKEITLTAISRTEFFDEDGAKVVFEFERETVRRFRWSSGRRIIEAERIP